MKLKLEDNTQEAFQFLMLGAAIVLVIRALIAGIGLWLESGTSHELADAVSAYRNSYLLHKGNVIVIGGMDIFGRLSFAFLLAVIAGILGSIIGAGIAKLLKRSSLSAAVQGARFGLLIVFAVATYSALFLPARAVELTDEGALFLERPSLPGGSSFPLPAKSELITWDRVKDLQLHSRAEGIQGCGVHEEVILRSDQRQRIVAVAIPSGNDCDQAIGEAQGNAERLIKAIERKFLAARDPQR